eukprot:4925655-Pleurochrysis_carterae.AAC.2
MSSMPLRAAPLDAKTLPPGQHAGSFSRAVSAYARVRTRKHAHTHSDSCADADRHRRSCRHTYCGTHMHIDRDAGRHTDTDAGTHTQAHRRSVEPIHSRHR